MKLTLAFVILFALTLFSGCAMQERSEFNSYKKDMDSRVNSGYIKKSAYYEGLYSKTNNRGSFSNKSDLLTYYSTMIDASYDLEEGKITQRGFNIIKRQADAFKAASDAAEAQRQNQNLYNIGKQMELMGTPMMYR
jgi:hypothetical protein